MEGPSQRKLVISSPCGVRPRQVQKTFTVSQRALDKFRETDPLITVRTTM